MLDKKVVMEGIEVYKDIVSQVKTSLEDLVDEGVMTPQVAERVLSELQFSTFGQHVNINYK